LLPRPHFQRADFFAFTEAERAVADRRKGPVERLHCLLQIGYFKAKQAFFNFDRPDVPTEDIEFLLERYFLRGTVALRPLRQDERYGVEGPSLRKRTVRKENTD